MSNMFVVRMQVAIKGFYKGININMSIKKFIISCCTRCGIQSATWIAKCTSKGLT